jgi:hypothetical protein
LPFEKHADTRTIHRPPEKGCAAKKEVEQKKYFLRGIFDPYHISLLSKQWTGCFHSKWEKSASL